MGQSETTATIRRVLAHYDLPQTLMNYKQLVNGHINDTYQIILADGNKERQYILQRINDYVFKNPIQVMENIKAITNYLESKEMHSNDCRIITFINDKEGNNYTVCDSSVWRLCQYVENSIAYEHIENTKILVSAGYAFGRFQTLLADMPIDQLTETIPGFHDTPARFNQLFAIAQEDPFSRVPKVSHELNFFLQHRTLAGRLANLLEAGELPLRVTHNDTKYNNILMHRKTNEPLCVIDLDTVMPGLSMYDYGDAIRFAANEAMEDETDLNKVRLNMDYFEAFTRGFMEVAQSFLTPCEIEHMALGAVVITIELASRFLADYLNGDRYFRIHRPDHNLDRAKNQIRLAQDMIAHLPEMNQIVKNQII